MKIFVGVLALGLTASGLVMSQQDREGVGRQDREGRRGSDVAGDPDKFFMACAAMMNLAEISAGRLAEQRSQNDAVKQFGQQMVKDHSQANSELAQLAKQKGVPMPAQADEGSALMVAHLSKLQGADFDQEYVTLMVGDHAKAVALFEAKSQSAKDPDLKAWAGKMLPGLKHHLEMAKDLQPKVSTKESK